MKDAWIFWPKKTEKTTEPVKTEDNAGGNGSSTTKTKTAKSKATKIVDISKWQGKIDFKALAEEAALVIARASCGSDKDVKIDEYAKAMNENGIHFGVYCYSYAGTTAKAKEEAQNMVKYTKKYNPLFYVMDAEEKKIIKEAIVAFADELKAQGAKKIGCYVANHRYKEYEYDSISYKFDFDWIPKYGKNDGTVEGAIKPKYKCDLWQFTSNGKIAGIKGKADLNVITGDGHDLEWFLEK